MILPAIMGATARRFDPDTVLLLPMTGANNSTTFTDIAKGGNAPHTVTAYGDAKISTAVADPFGASNGVGYFDGTGDYLIAPNSDDWDATSDGLTVEFWVKIISDDSASKGYTQSLIATMRLLETAGWLLGYFDGAYRISFANQTNQSFHSLSVGSWVHAAMVWDGASIKVYIDGTERFSASTTNTSNANSLIIASESPYNSDRTAYVNMSDLRISKTARYTANFTPPARLKP